MTSGEIIHALKVAGWYLVRVKGSHHHFAHPSILPGIVTVPHPRKDVPMGTLKSIEKQAQRRLR